jgi:hypothetical protein
MIVPAAAVDLAALPQFMNVIIETDMPKHKWLEEATTAIGEWRAKFRSTYM